MTSNDLNTKFYHASTIIRRCRYQIIKLKNDELGWVSGRAAIGKELVDFYQQLFQSSSPDIPTDLEHLIEPLITPEDNAMLTSVPNADEIFLTIKKMSPEKALGPNGMTVFFFRFFWDVVGLDVIHTVQDFFINDHLLPALNHTNITLIPKVDNPAKVSQFRPISLCNVMYKVI